MLTLSIQPEQSAQQSEMQRDKVRENKVRRSLHRQGYVLHKSKVRDTRAIGYGQFHIADQNNRIVAGGQTQNGYDMTLEDVERWAREGA